MHVKEISLDGFKSYAQRVVIPGFDSQFNAITGLNGSGKSNILDSICFVLGISNLQQVGLIKFALTKLLGIVDHLIERDQRIF
jgi:recombinational DNA repair ATPase RecF